MKRVAVFVPGGVANVQSPFRIPSLSCLLEQLSLDYELTVFSFLPIPQGRFPSGWENLQFFCPLENSPRIPLARIIISLKMFLTEHFKKRFRLLHGFWAVPAGFVAVLLGKMLKIPTIVSLQGGEGAFLPQLKYGNMIGRFQRWLTLFTCRQADELVALTRFQREGIERFGLKRPRIHIQPYGARPYFFVNYLKNPEPPYRFLYVGNIHPVKDPETLLNTFALISKQTEARLRIAGPDYSFGHLQHLIHTLNLTERVDVTGYIPHHELPKHYQWADFLLLTSRYEGQAVVIAEAAAAGVLICGTRVGLIADMDQRCTVSAAVGDSRTLAEKVLHIIVHSKQYREKQIHARKWAEKNNARHTVGEYQKIYDKLLKGRTG